VTFSSNDVQIVPLLYLGHELVIHTRTYFLAIPDN
jgi:hypothetical protein